MPRSPPRPPKIAKMTPQVASRWPAQPHLRPSWRQLGPILAPSSATLPPFWASRACPKFAKIGQDSLRVDFHAKIASKNSQTPSRHRFRSALRRCRRPQTRPKQFRASPFRLSIGVVLLLKVRAKRAGPKGPSGPLGRPSAPLGRALLIFDFYVHF